MTLTSLVSDKNYALNISCGAHHCTGASFMLIKMQFAIQILPTKIIMLTTSNILYKLVDASFKLTLLESTSPVLASKFLELEFKLFRLIFEFYVGIR